MSEGSTEAARVPAVVAIVVTRDPGPWFDDTLQGLATQDYVDLAVLVIVSGGSGDPTDRVAAALPEAFVRRLPEDRGFGAAVDEAMGMVEGASFFLLCHDDCALAPDAVHLLVEESFRSNAGVVSPKMVHWDDPRALLHVGQNIDKTGAVVERVHDGEIDAGQHDAVRDVFVAPGGCTLVRADLLTALDGFDRAIPAMGEDLNLSWRAHLAGARVVVGPAARVRHLELVAGGARPTVPSGAPSLQALQRRNELYTVLTCYSWLSLLRVLPQAAALAAGEALVAVLVGDLRRVRAVAHAWQWNLARVRSIRRRRVEVQRLRAVSDGDLRGLQLRRSTRLTTYFSRLTHQGVQAAHGLLPGNRREVGGQAGAPAGGPPAGGPPAGGTVAGARLAQAGGVPGGAVPELTGSIGSAFSEDADFDDLDDLGRRGARSRQQGMLATRRGRLLAWLVIVLVLVLGTRNLIGKPWPLVAQFSPFASWTSTWHAFVASTQPAGVGSHAPSSPAFGILGLLGTLLAGRMGLLQEVVLLGCVPAGAWGLSRLLRPFASPRARFAGVFAYLALPLAYDALARGRWDGLVAYAATPWIIGQLAAATGIEPFGSQAGSGPAAPRWRRGLPGRIAVAGAVEAAATAVAPAMALVVVLAGLGIAVGSLPTGSRRAGARALLAALGSTAVALLLLLPWTVATLSAGRGALAVLGLPGRPSTLPGWGGLLRMAVGPIGGSPLGWLLVAVAVAPLLVARGPRFAWAVRLWAVALLGWWVALVSAKAWGGSFAPSVDVMLAPAAVAVAVGAGLAVQAFEADLAGYRFGWRQAVAALSMAALAVGALPTLVEAANGRWGVPTTGFAQAAGLPAPGRAGYRVLWVGDPQALPLGGWSIGPGLAYATSSDGTPSLRQLWPPAHPGPVTQVARDVVVAMRGQTVRLGSLLAGAGIRYVVVVHALAPTAPGTGVASAYAVPPGLDAALGRQEDLRTVPVSVGGLTVYQNAAPRRAAATIGPAGSAGLLDPLGAGLELVLWLGVGLVLVAGRRRLPASAARRRGAGAGTGWRARGQRHRGAPAPARRAPPVATVAPGQREADATLDPRQGSGTPASGAPASGTPASGAPAEGGPVVGRRARVPGGEAT